MFEMMSSLSSSSSSSVSPTACTKPKFFTDFSIRALIGSHETETSTVSARQHQSLNFHNAIFTNTSTSSASSPSQSTTLVGQDLRTRMATLALDSTSNAVPATDTTGQAQRKYRPKNFQCPACKMAFSNNGQLRTHVRIHTGERPFQCNHPDCNKTFTRNEELTRHKLIHTGVRPHSCASCGKRFGRKDHLKKHVKTHERKNTIMRKEVFMPAHSATGYMNHHHHHHQEAEAIFLFKDKLRKALEAQAKLEDLRI